MRIVEEIHRAARARPELKVDVLMDYSRAIRKDSNGINAVHLLKNTLECRNMQVFLFQPPRISALGRFASGKLGEVLGVQHMKFYIFDDHVILSG